MSLPAGTRLGPYEIQSALGAGGMGEVYRARDTRLDRNVAIKVLPAGVAEPDRLSRFEQEARAAAALNHPNILAVFDFGAYEGAPFIVTELLEGETLRARVDAGALPVRRAIAIAVEIARGLAAAHEKGIVHRDLKPENVFVTADERVKILDFGLAKLTQPAAAAGGSMLATGMPDTVPGMVMGTVGYMSPEQVRGAIADHRSDIFALGAVLYEMLTGELAFRRDTPAETMTAILRDDPPPLTASARLLPPALDRIVRRCLEKNPAARFQSALDLAFALEALETATGSGVAAAVAARAPWRERIAWAVAAVSLAFAAAIGGMTYLRPAPELRALQFTILPPEGWQLTPGAGQALLSVSPDGRTLAFVARQGVGATQLLVRPLDAAVARPLSGTEGATQPFWSPDNRWLGFLADGKLKNVDVSGRGSVVTLADAPAALTATWGADGTIVFMEFVGGLRKVSDAGGTPEPATTLGPGETRHGRPVFLPDGRRLLYSALVLDDDALPARHLYATTLGSSDRTLLAASEPSNADYSQGHLLFIRGTSLMAQPFDADAFALAGEAVTVADDVDFVSQTAGLFGIFSASDSGVLAYSTRSTLQVHQLTWFDRSGRQIGQLGDRASYGNVELLTGGARVAIGIVDPARRTRDIWLFDVARGLRTRFTFDPAEERTAIWSPDGRDIVFNSTRAGALELYRQALSGAGGEQLLLKDGRSKDPMDWSPDGQYVLYRVTGETQTNDIWVLPLSGDRTPRPVVATPFDENYPRISPDGRWMAYTSNESGQFEVYVTQFPAGGGKWQVFTAGGEFPRWRGDGKELYYLAGERTMTAVAVNGTTTAFEVGGAQGLFRAAPPNAGGYPYDVTPDGQRFLINTDVAPPTPITVIVNWTATLPSR